MAMRMAFVMCVPTEVILVHQQALHPRHQNHQWPWVAQACVTVPWPAVTPSGVTHLLETADWQLRSQAKLFAWPLCKTQCFPAITQACWTHLCRECLHTKANIIFGLFFFSLRIFHEAFLIFTLYLPKLVHSPFLRDFFFILKVSLPPFLWTQLSYEPSFPRPRNLPESWSCPRVWSWLWTAFLTFCHVICFTPGERSFQLPFMTGLLWSKGLKWFFFSSFWQ